MRRERGGEDKVREEMEEQTNEKGRKENKGGRRNEGTG